VHASILHVSGPGNVACSTAPEQTNLETKHAEQRKEEGKRERDSGKAREAIVMRRRWILKACIQPYHPEELVGVRLASTPVWALKRHFLHRRGHTRSHHTIQSTPPPLAPIYVQRDSLLSLFGRSSGSSSGAPLPPVPELLSDASRRCAPCVPSLVPRPICKGRRIQMVRKRW
jgi:hypothetical protein